MKRIASTLRALWRRATASRTAEVAGDIVGLACIFAMTYALLLAALAFG